MIRAAALLAATAALTFAPTAHATDYMFRIGTDIQPGDYTYRVVGADWGSWELCSNTSCSLDSGLIDMDMIDGAGQTGYLTVPATAKYLKTSYLQLYPG